MNKDQTIVTTEEFNQALDALVNQIIQKHNTDFPQLVGIGRSGHYVASRLAKNIRGDSPPIELPIGLYRDDFENTLTPVYGNPDYPSSGFHEQNLILVIDAYVTGRTALAGIHAVTETGRPKRIELAALYAGEVSASTVPIKLDYIGIRGLIADRVDLRGMGQNESPYMITIVQKST